MHPRLTFFSGTRDSLKGQDLSFTEIAKLVGERWQLLTPEEREPFEREATTAKEKYYAQLAEYKKTPQYKEYQEYLADFRAKYPAQPPGTHVRGISLSTRQALRLMQKANARSLIQRQASRHGVVAVRSPKDLVDASALGLRRPSIDIPELPLVLRPVRIPIARHRPTPRRLLRKRLVLNDPQRLMVTIPQCRSRQVPIPNILGDHFRV